MRVSKRLWEKMAKSPRKNPVDLRLTSRLIQKPKVRNLRCIYILMFNACLQDWYIGHSDPEAQPPTTSESGILVPPVLSTVQPTATMPASAASQQAQQSLGLGLPQAIRQSDSLRRRVTPIPSIHFIPSLDHNSGLSNELETLASRNPATPTDQPQQPAAAADDDEPPAPADESQAPAPSGSKRGKTRGSKTSKASGSRGRGKQRAN